MAQALALVLLALSLIVGCGPNDAANARRVIREQHAGELKKMIRDDIARHLHGVEAAGGRIAPGFLVEDTARRDPQMRTALRLLTKPPRGIPELIVSARTFTAAVDVGGVVIATDAKK